MPVLAGLHVYPIKSCAGIVLSDAPVWRTGLAYDRTWMVVDAAGTMLTQRTVPRLALVRTAFDAPDLRVWAPGMGELRTPLEVTDPDASASVATQVWQAALRALDTGPACAAWFSDFLGMPARLLRFDPRVERRVASSWHVGAPAPFHFADGFPLLVTSVASLDDLNARLSRKGAPMIPMDRFRPNLIVDGWEAYEEDHITDLTIRAPGADVGIRLVAPCSRCPMPTIDQRTAARDPLWPNEPTDTLATYRRDARVGDAVTFGWNGVVTAGVGAHLATGQRIEAELDFGD
ncbi:MOSC N-terminal beta barrel domain-containing protein [Robbsia sp. Bb-Pol-6]|uniref:MOSC N-terminal beta barrel domain-containing protein n=1 Tax=Robbsia betulipollinis TaxID=2981849 RepID=A0ABT3ZHT6_9BURK|nr:MOSC N-terminal beta barrel domain-containing protein [Robbsia betulipollinis]MCY0386098.1 MOSC N-terminal beta barrel domain-containing protein [Robbsia betulipollinis]